MQSGRHSGIWRSTQSESGGGQPYGKKSEKTRTYGNQEKKRAAREPTALGSSSQEGSIDLRKIKRPEGGEKGNDRGEMMRAVQSSGEGEDHPQ